MKKGLLFTVSILFVTFLSAQDLKTITINRAECVNGHIIVKFKKDFSDAGGQDISILRQNLISKYRSTVKKQWKMKAELWQIDTLQMPRATQTILDSLKKLPYVQYAEPDFIVKADMIPNDPSFNQLWGMHNTGQNGGTPGADIKAPQAWDITTGDTNIIVGVIDTGIDYLHPDLSANIWTNWDEIPGNGIDDDNNGYIDDVHGWDFSNNDNNPMDDNFHGTHVAGTIGAVGNNGIGVAGVAWKVRLMPLKFLDHNGNGYTSNAISAIEYATENGARLTNNSWGGGEVSQALFDAINSANSAGILFIVSAGNNSSDNDNTPYYPSCFNLDNIISVASTDSKDSLSVFSNWGLSNVDIAAPGSSIFSTKPNNTYGELSGTSMAAPHVAGAAVLAWAKFPGFTHHQIKQQLLGSSDQKNHLLNKISSGGRLNSYHAVNDTAFSLEFRPRTLSFGAEIINHQSNVQKISITNYWPHPILIDSIISPPGFKIRNGSSYSNKIYGMIVPANHTDSLNVVFYPDSAITYNRNLSFYYWINGIMKRNPILLMGFGFSDGTIIPGGTVSGIWDSMGSPYIINGDITIQTNSSLIIKPGVKILFNGHYGIWVNTNASLRAIGNINDSIAFSAIDTLQGWNGILFWSSIYDTLSFCSIEYVKFPYRSFMGLGGTNGIRAENSFPFISNNLISKNIQEQSGANYGVVFIASPALLISNNGSYSPGFINNKVINNDGCALSIRFCFNMQVDRNFISNNDGVGIDIQGCSNVRLSNNVIVNNTGGSCATGGLFINNSNLNLINNVIACNSELPNGGISFSAIHQENDSIYMLNNIIWGNNGGAIINGPPNLTVKYSDVEGGFSGEGNLNINPQFVSPTIVPGGSQKGYLADWNLQLGSLCKNTGSHYTRLNSDFTRTDMGAYGGLGSFPSNEYTYIGGELSDTLSMGNYLVYDDIFIKNKHSLTINAGTSMKFFGSRIVIDSSKLIIQGTQSQPVTMDRFDKSNWGGLNFYYCADTSEIQNLKIQRSVNGGIINITSNVKIKKSTISNNISKYENTAAGITALNNLQYPYGSLIIQNSEIFNNNAIALTPGDIYIGVGGIYSSRMKLKIQGSKICNNFSNGEVAGAICCVNYESIVDISNCLIANNSLLGNLPHPTTIRIWGCGKSSIENCTIANNLTQGNKCQISNDYNDNPLKITNCIIWSSDSTVFPIKNFWDSAIVSHSLLNIQYPGSGNIQGNPLFINPSSGAGCNYSGINADWQLQPNSPCIDGGINDSVFSERDIAGNTRIWDGDSNGVANVDMGAYEYGAPPFLPGISGHYCYNNTGNTPLDSISVGLNFNGVKIDSTHSNVAGQYQFLQKGPGNYNLIAQSQKPWNGVNGTDALKVQRHFAGIELLTEPVRLLAADVNASGSINGTDALKIKRRFAGLDTTFAAGDWTFAKPTVGGNTVSVQDENVVQNFYGLCVGDVNGSFVPGPGAKSSSAVSLAYKPSIEVHPGQEFLLPVTVDQASDVSALSLVLKFPEEKIRIQDVRMQDGREVVFRQFANEVRMAWSEVTPLELNRGDTLLTINCKVADELVKDELIYPEITSETELADRSAKVISGSTLNINPIQLKTGKLPDNAPNSENDGLQIIPNPHTGQFIIQTNATFSGIGEVRIFDNTGKKIYSNTAIRFNQGKSGTLKMNDLEAGVYLIELKSEDSEFKATMIIK